MAALRTHTPLGPCMAAATSGIPPKHTLWHTNVCSPRFGMYHALDGSVVEDEDAHVPEVGDAWGLYMCMIASSGAGCLTVPLCCRCRRHAVCFVVTQALLAWYCIVSAVTCMTLHQLILLCSRSGALTCYQNPRCVLGCSCLLTAVKQPHAHRYLQWRHP